MIGEVLLRFFLLISLISFLLSESQLQAFFKSCRLNSKISTLRREQSSSQEDLIVTLEKMQSITNQDLNRFFFFSAMLDFIEVYKKYDANEVKIEDLMRKIRRKPRVYSKLLKKSSESIIFREAHNFYPMYWFSEQQFLMLSQFNQMFKRHEKFFDILIYIRDNRMNYDKINSTRPTKNQAIILPSAPLMEEDDYFISCKDVSVSCPN